MEKKLEGIGGWLILPIIGFVITVLIQLFDAVELMQLYYLGDIYFYVLLDLAVATIFIITIVKIFKKDYTAPKWAIASLIIGGVINIIVGLLYTIPGTIIWILYFTKSKRVKNTFNSQNRRRTK